MEDSERLVRKLHQPLLGFGLRSSWFFVKNINEIETEFRYQRSTTAISVAAPIFYAHLAAAQLGQFMKFEEASETSSSHGVVTTPGVAPLVQLHRLHENVCKEMFFC